MLFIVADGAGVVVDVVVVEMCFCVYCLCVVSPENQYYAFI